MINDNSILLFYRPRQHPEDIGYKQAFLKANKDIIGSSRIIDFTSGDQELARKIRELAGKQKRYTIIHTSFLSERESYAINNLYGYFKCLRIIGAANYYLMDSEGRLYKEVDKIEKW